MKTIKMKFQIDNTPELTYWEEAEVDEEVNAEEYYTIMIKRFNEGLRPYESSRTILEIVDPTLKNKPKPLNKKSGDDDRQKVKIEKKDYGYRNAFDGIKYQRLRKKIKAQHKLDMPEFAVRQYGGWAMKSRGQWSWFTIQSEYFPRIFGSQVSVTELLKAHCLTISMIENLDYDVDPCLHEVAKK